MCAVDSEMKLGEAILATDHVMMSGRNPLFGPNEERWGTRFPDVTELYSSSINEKVAKLATVCLIICVFPFFKNSVLNQSPQDLGIKHHSMPYVHVIGPVCRSDVSSRFFSKLDLKVLCTGVAPEVVIARHMKMKMGVLGIITAITSENKQEKDSKPPPYLDSLLSQLFSLDMK